MRFCPNVIFEYLRIAPDLLVLEQSLDKMNGTYTELLGISPELVLCLLSARDEGFHSERS